MMYQLKMSWSSWNRRKEKCLTNFNGVNEPFYLKLLRERTNSLRCQGFNIAHSKSMTCTVPQILQHVSLFVNKIIKRVFSLAARAVPIKLWLTGLGWS